MALLADHHAADVALPTRADFVEIDPTGDCLTELVATVPVGCGVAGVVFARIDVAEVQPSYHLPANVVDSDRHLARVGKVKRDPRLGVERVGIVGQQRRRLGPQRCEQRLESWQPVSEQA